MQKKDTYIDITYRYLHKINEESNESKILNKYGIENYKEFKKGFTNNRIYFIDTFPEEIVKDSNITRVEK